MLVALLMSQEVAEDIALVDGEAVVSVFHGSRESLSVDACNDAACIVAHCVEAGECLVALITGFVVCIGPLRVKVAAIERGFAEGVDGILDGVVKLLVFQAERCGSSAVEMDGGNVGNDGGGHSFRRCGSRRR